jgi:putative pyruvate formate lyase activating enzyme
MEQCPDLPPIVWKSDFHFTPEALDLLCNAVDVYVADFKFGNDACARRIASIDRYVSIVTRNLLLAAQRGNLIVRHLLLPGHFDCCYRPIVDWMKEYLPSAKFSIRDGYLPSWQATRHAELAHHLKPAEGRAARELASGAALNVIV